MERIKRIYLIIILLVFLSVGSLIITYYKKIHVKKAYVVEKTIANYNFMLKKTEYYVSLNSKINLEIDNPNNVQYKINIVNPDIASIENNEIVAKNIGYTDFSIKIKNFNCFNGRIYVVNGIEQSKETFDKSKKFISCNQFSEEENEILDKTLEDRVNTAGFKTRAGVVAAARFLTLEFSYRIPYFYENGRLNNYGSIKKVDGEGRYYHKGLYLSKGKYKDISNKFTGHGSWGCKIMQFEDEPGYNFVPKVKYPNGFDCSGFISWVLLNGGFDVGDNGAGDILGRNDDLYDLGIKTKITDELLFSKDVKVGDLIAYSGHMAIIAGIDNELNYYVAESLPQFKGVVLNKYNTVKLKNTFTHIMLMDNVYKNDGYLTNMWY